MQASINRSGCIGCGLCVDTCPEVFQMADDGLAEVIVDEVSAEHKEAAETARDNCPVSVIDVN